MTRYSMWVLAVALTALCGTPSARAQSALEGILKKPKLSREDQASLEAEVKNKAKQLIDAPNAQALTDRRDFLIRLTKTSGATPAGLAALANAAADPLQVVATGEAFDAAYAATQVLNEMQHPNIIRAQVAACASAFPAVRYSAAKGIKTTLPKLEAGSADFASAMEGLGQQGAKESDPIVLRMIYDAIDVHAAGINAKDGDTCAAALAAVFRGRLEALLGGSRDESKDARGYKGAAACYEKAGKEARVQLIGALAGLLDYCVDRYFDPDTSVESRPRVAEVAEDQEKVILAMIKASGVKEPGKSIATLLKARATDVAKQEADARAALEELHVVLRGDPWKLP